jgi:predicted DsbA family dithiol-disulfide isomerase
VRIEKLKQNFNVDIKLVHFPLHPDTPLEGKSMADLYAGRNADPDEMYRQMKERMDAEGLPYGKRTHTYNSRKAQELGKWADTQENGDVLHDALYRAYFVDTKNIGDVDVLVGVAEDNGFDGAEVRKVLEEDTFAAAVDEDWTKSRAYGVTGVPTFVAGGFGVVGAQPYEALEQLMNEVGAAKIE